MWEYYLEQEFAYRFIGGIILMLMVLSIFLLIGILISRTVKNRQEKKRAYWHDRFQNLLVKLLFEPEYKKGGDRYKKIINKYNAKDLPKIVRRTLVEDMMELHKGVMGESAIVLQDFYVDVNLDHFAKIDIKRGAWYYKARGFRELSEFNVKDSYKLIVRYVDHNNKILRQEAQYAAVVLKGPEALNFVPKLKTPISEWQQLVLLEKLVKFMPEDIPDVDHWLDSKNDSVIVFASRIIAHFQKFQSGDKVLDQTMHKNPYVAIKCLECIRELQYKRGCSKLRDFYSKVTEDVQVRILDTLAQLGDTGDLNFFKHEVEERERFDIAMHAAMALRQLGGKPILKILDNKELKFPKNNEIVRHALDERI